MKSISIKQPWASLIVHGIKDIENRTWKCPQKYIGKRVLIHSSSSKKGGWNLTRGQESSLEQSDSIINHIFFDQLPFGAIIGSVKIVDCVQNHPSVWAERGVYNWVLSEPILYENRIENVKGKLSLWNYDKVEEITIECPECGTIQSAVVDCLTAPFKYIHDCKHCGHLIEESESYSAESSGLMGI